MQAKVAYWASQYRPGNEAISKEIHELQHRRPGSKVFCLSQQHRLWWKPSQSCFHLGRSYYQALCLLAPLVESAFAINHVFGSIDEWGLLRFLRRRPTALTLVAGGESVSPLIHKADMIVAEEPTLAERVLETGISAERVRVVVPGVAGPKELPAFPERSTLRLLFASSPHADAPLEARGLDVLLKAVAHYEKAHLTILWRDWSGPRSRVDAMIEKLCPGRVEVVTGLANVPDHLARSHAVVAPFRSGKASPNSVLESLAYARPVLLSPHVGIAPELKGRGALIADLEPSAWIEAFRGTHEQLDSLSALARTTFLERFSLEQWLAQYRAIYAELLEVPATCRPALAG